MAAKFAEIFGIVLGVFSGFGLLIGCLATGRTRFNVCGAWKTRFAGRCCVIMVSMDKYGYSLLLVYWLTVSEHSCDSRHPLLVFKIFF